MDPRIPEDPAAAFPWKGYAIGVTVTEDELARQFDPVEEPPRRRWGLWLGIALWFALMILVIAGAFAAPALAHSWYDSECCSGRDCAPVPDHAIEAMADGYHVTLLPGDHPLIKEPLRTVVPYGDERIYLSKDGKQHACVSYPRPDGFQGLLCIYVTGAGA